MGSSLFNRLLSRPGAIALLAASILGGGARAVAAGPQFTNISQSDFDKISREFSANSSLHNVMPPSSLGNIFGFEVGLAGGLTTVPEIEKLVKEADASSQFKAAPHAGLVGAVSVPMGLTAEAVMIPKVEADGASFSQYAGALKWSLSDSVLPILPINLAVRGFLSQTEVKFSQTATSISPPATATVGVTYEGRVMGLQLLASPKFIPLIEPYAGIGYLSASGDMKVTGSTTATIFDTQRLSMSSSPTSSQLLLGVNIRLLVLVVGAEYSRAFGTESVTGKVSLRF